MWSTPADAIDFGLREVWNELWTQGTPDVAGKPESGDRLGSTAHAGDFDNDGLADLVIGVPEEKTANDLGIQRDAAGVVHVLYGQSGGLTSERNELWYQGSPNISGEVELADRFGTSLASGHFNADSYEDLVVGVPNEDVDLLGLGIETEDVGVVHVIYGGPWGLSGDGSQLWSQENAGISGNGEFADRFGAVLAVGNFNGDDLDDLAIGVPNEDISGDDAGVVHVLYGYTNPLDPTDSGLSTVDQELWHQDSENPDIPGSTETGDEFGRALAAGDFDGDGFDDLAIGVPFEDLGNIVDAGLLQLLFGTASGLIPEADYWTQNEPVYLDDAATGDRFAQTLAAGDFDGDGYSDLVIGVPYEDSPDVDSGLVHVLYGSEPPALRTRPPQTFSQGSFGSAESEEANDRFGEQLLAADFDGDGFDDLAIGVPSEDLSGLPDAGVAHVLYGSATGLSTSRHRIWSQEEPCIESDAAAGDSFGSSLAAGDFDGNGAADLAVGAPDEDVQADLTTYTGAGAMHVLYSNRFVAREFDHDADDDLDGLDLVQLIDEWIATGSTNEAPLAAFATEFGRFIPSTSPPAMDDEIEVHLTAHAPRVWLNEEPLPNGFWPSSVEWAFAQSGPSLERFANTDDGNRYWLRTVPNLATPASVLESLFHGHDLADVVDPIPVYAFWIRKQEEVCGYTVGGEVVDLVYWLYYPYNRGKQVDFPIFTTFGHHVGDWEHLTVRMKWRRRGQGPANWSWGAEPTKIYLAHHREGDVFDWDGYEKTDGLQTSCTAEECTHPVVYAARGSHGLWEQPGPHQYDMAVLTPLIDECAADTAWDTWEEKVETFEYVDPATNTGRGLGMSVWPAWMSTAFTTPGTVPSDPSAGAIYRWGNPAGSADSTQGFFDCVPPVTTNCDPIFGYYRLEQGPTGPVSKNVWSPDLR